jgi:hypothetical protein
MALIAGGYAETALNRFHLLLHLFCWGVPGALSVPFIPYISNIEAFNGQLTTW